MAADAADRGASPGAGERGEVSTFDRWRIDALVREWCSTPLFADVEPSLIDGLCSVLRLRLERADRAASACRSPALGVLTPGVDLVELIAEVDQAAWAAANAQDKPTAERAASRRYAALQAAIEAASASRPPAAGGVAAEDHPVALDYTNFRGERSTRTVIPTGRLLPGDATYHPTARWVIEAWDVDKGAMRTFDPAHVHAWGDQQLRSSAAAPARHGGAEDAGAVREAAQAVVDFVLSAPRHLRPSVPIPLELLATLETALAAAGGDGSAGEGWRACGTCFTPDACRSWQTCGAVSAPPAAPPESAK